MKPTAAISEEKKNGRERFLIMTRKLVSSEIRFYVNIIGLVIRSIRTRVVAITCYYIAVCEYKKSRRSKLCSRRGSSAVMIAARRFYFSRKISSGIRKISPLKRRRNKKKKKTERFVQRSSNTPNFDDSKESSFVNFFHFIL